MSPSLPKDYCGRCLGSSFYARIHEIFDEEGWSEVGFICASMSKLSDLFHNSPMKLSSSEANPKFANPNRLQPATQMQHFNATAVFDT